MTIVDARPPRKRSNARAFYFAADVQTLYHRSSDKAIAYCQSDPPEIREDMEREERVMEATGMNDPDYKYGGKYRMLSPQERARLGL